jgi:TolB-like protein/DNA-binding winged helix-turn-helix (wHTH) protein/Tfp pilus assembly protein PilF
MPAATGQVLQIGEWCVDPALGEISSGGRVTKLDPLTMRLLLYFAENAGRVVALKELLDAVWPNVVVTSQSVYNTVAQLRRTLGDLAEAPTYIANIPRMGYRLIAKVEHRTVERRAAATPAASTAVGGVLPARSRLGAPRTVIAVIAVILAGLAVMLLARTGIFGARTAASEPAAQHSIAIMPFRDLSEGKDREYLAEGLAEEVGTVLSQVPRLRVIGRASAFALRSASVAEIANQLHVDHVLEGSVQTSAHGLRITAALIRTDTGQYLWSKTYDRATDDYFRIEDEIADEIAGALTNTALPLRRAAGSCSESGEANNLLLQGRYLGRRNTRAERERSMDLYEKALVLEPNCARAWAWLSTGYGIQAAYGWVAADVGYGRARDAAEHALGLDPLDADAHAALAYVEENYDWNWSGAEAELKRALALDAGDVRVLNMNGHLAMDLGQTDRAIELYRRAVNRDPLSPGALGGLATALWSRGQLAEAEAMYRRQAALSSGRSHTWIGLVILDRGDKTAALAEVERETEPVERLLGLGIVESALGNHEASDRELAELIATYPDHPYEIAQLYAQRGDSDAAFQWLERAYTQHNTQLNWLKITLMLRPLHGDPRFAALLHRMGLPP